MSVPSPRKSRRSATPIINESTPILIDDLRTPANSMADALDGYTCVITKLVGQADPPSRRRRLPGPLDDLLANLDPQIGNFNRAFREAGHRWPDGTGVEWIAVSDMLVNETYPVAARLVRSLTDERRGNGHSQRGLNGTLMTLRLRSR